MPSTSTSMSMSMSMSMLPSDEKPGLAVTPTVRKYTEYYSRDSIIAQKAVRAVGGCLALAVTLQRSDGVEDGRRTISRRACQTHGWQASGAVYLSVCQDDKTTRQGSGL